MSLYAPIFFILLLGGGLQLYCIQEIFTENNTGFLRSRNVTTESVNITMYIDDDIEVYENDDYLTDYSTYIKPKTTQKNTQNSSDSYIVNDKQVVRYFDRNDWIEVGR